MAYLIDTNVLLRDLQANDLDHATAVSAVVNLMQQHEKLHVAPQNLIEVWNVASRPVNRNGLGPSPAQAEAKVSALESIFPLLQSSPDVFREWKRLAVTYGVSGIQVHDTHLVAAMKANGIVNLLTFNPNDFSRFQPEGIIVVHPRNVATIP